MSCKNFHEPWFVTKSMMQGPKPNIEDLPEETAERILDAWERCNENSSYLVWGCGLNEPGKARGLTSGKEIEMNGNGIIFTVYNHRGWINGSPTPKQIAERVILCVNAMQGVIDPDHFVKRAREAMIQNVHQDVGAESGE